MRAQPGRIRGVLLEAVLAGLIGIVLAFAANALSPHGLKLSRNYSPGRAVAALHTPGVAGQNTTEQLKNQFAAEGLQLANSNLVAQLFHDPTKEQGLIVFVDARDDEHYQAGHMPGAYQLDHYHPEKYLPMVLPACQIAQKVLVYCKGGSCEDSEQTAIFLRDAGIPKDHLYVYAGGFDEWSANHQPIELGDRDSGQLENPAPNSTGGKK